MKVVDRVTLQYMKRNKGRTWVTILGAVISVAMLSAVIVIVCSAQDMLLRHTIESGGQWETRFFGVPAEKAGEAGNSEEVASFGISTVGKYASYPGGENTNKPYLYVSGETNFDISNTQIREGRLPQTDSEIIVSESFSLRNPDAGAIGSRLKVAFGRRMSEEDGKKFELGTNYSYGGYDETFEAEEEREYTIVGTFEAPDKEAEAFGAYRAMYRLDENALSENGLYEVTVDYKDYKRLGNKVYTVSKELKDTLGAADLKYNTGLLGYSGISNDSAFMSMVYMLAAVVGIIILIGSISLIYNAFSISIAERSRTFGMLSSVGATRQQKRHSVFFEAMCVGAVAIPLGLAAGIAGMAITFKLINPVFREWMQDVLGLEVSISPGGIAAIVLFSALVLLISAWIPSRHASRVSALEAIRQSKEYKITSKSVRTSKLTCLVFGFEGELGLKNLKRNKSHYRATVFSLTVSVLLFMTAYTFSAYVSKSNDMIQAPLSYDINVSMSDDMDSMDQLTEELMSVEGTGSAVAVKKLRGEVEFPAEMVGSELAAVYPAENGKYNISTILVAMDDASLKSYLMEQGISEDALLGDKTKGILINRINFKKGHEFAELDLLSGVKAGDLLDLRVADGEKNLAEDEITLAAVSGGKTPFGNKYVTDVYSIEMIVSMETMDRICAMLPEPKYFVTEYVYYTMGENEDLEDEVRTICNKYRDVSSRVTSIAAEQKQTMDGVIIVSVFLYGFVALIALVSMANIMNTISTGMQLRRREFAMLQSVGMTPKGFRKMLTMEGLFYGIKGLAYGLPASLLVIFGMYKILRVNVSFSFFVPAGALIGAAAGVFALVGITMVYGKRKARASSIVEVLKDENA